MLRESALGVNTPVEVWDLGHTCGDRLMVTGQLVKAAGRDGCRGAEARRTTERVALQVETKAVRTLVRSANCTLVIRQSNRSILLPAHLNDQ